MRGHSLAGKQRLSAEIPARTGVKMNCHIVSRARVCSLTVSVGVAIHHGRRDDDVPLSTAFSLLAGARAPPGPGLLLIVCAAALAASPAAPVAPASCGPPRRPPRRALPAETADAATASPTRRRAWLDALDTAKLRPHVNEQVKIRGTPTGIGPQQGGQRGLPELRRRRTRPMALVVFFKPGQTGSRLTSEDDLKPVRGQGGRRDRQADRLQGRPPDRGGNARPDQGRALSDGPSLNLCMAAGRA